MAGPQSFDPGSVKRDLIARAHALGFQQVGVAGIELGEDERHLDAWLAAGFHGDMG